MVRRQTFRVCSRNPSPFSGERSWRDARAGMDISYERGWGQRMRIGFRPGSDLSRSWLLIKNSIARRKDSPSTSLNTVASRSAAWSLAVRLLTPLIVVNEAQGLLQVLFLTTADEFLQARQTQHARADTVVPFVPFPDHRRFAQGQTIRHGIAARKVETIQRQVPLLHEPHVIRVPQARHDFQHRRCSTQGRADLGQERQIAVLYAQHGGEESETYRPVHLLQKLAERSQHAGIELLPRRRKIDDDLRYLLLAVGSFVQGTVMDHAHAGQKKQTLGIVPLRLVGHLDVLAANVVVDVRAPGTDRVAHATGLDGAIRQLANIMLGSVMPTSGKYATMKSLDCNGVTSRLRSRNSSRWTSSNRLVSMSSCRRQWNRVRWKCPFNDAR